MNLTTNLQNLILRLYIHIWTYNIVYVNIKLYTHERIPEHIIMFEFGLFNSQA